MRVRHSLAFFSVLLASSAGAAAQQSPGPADSARAEIHTRLRAFYFNLAHKDWDALTADILAAKVVAHRPAPDALLAIVGLPRKEPQGRGAGSSPAASDTACSSAASAPVDQATIIFEGGWAEVSVPRCSSGPAGTDEFRLIRFEERWRFVYIDLSQSH
jgi:hypothetical protein